MRIVCLGDSNTKGLDPRSFIYEEYDYPWPRLLAKKVNKIVINEAEHGQCIYHTKEEYAYLDHVLKKEDWILLMLGTNDMLRERDPSIIESRLEALVDYLKSYRCILICPVDGNGKSLIELYRSVSRKYAIPCLNANDWNIPISFDEVHFSQEGHEVFAREVARYLDTVME